MMTFEASNDRKLKRQINFLLITLLFLLMIVILFLFYIINGYEKFVYVFESMKKFTDDYLLQRNLDLMIQLGGIIIIGLSLIYVLFFIMQIFFYVLQLIYLVKLRECTKIIITNNLKYVTIGLELEIEYKDIVKVYKKNSIFDKNHYILYKQALLTATSKIPWQIRIFQNIQSSELKCIGFDDEVIHEIEKRIARESKPPNPRLEPT